MTNGEKLMETFPSCKTKQPREDIIEITIDGIIGTCVMLDWWNAPYKCKKCEDCAEWEYFEGYGYGCFCMKTMTPIDANECEFYSYKWKSKYNSIWKFKCSKFIIRKL